MIELIIVMLALGIFVISLTPRDYGAPFNLETAVSKVEQDLRYARELAMTTNTNCGIDFLAQGSFTVYQTSPATPVVNPLTKQPFIFNLGQDFKNVQIMNSVRVEFNPAGRPVLGGGGLIQIGNTQTTAALMVTPNTGVIVRQ